MKVSLTILGEPASKANSRELVNFGRPVPWREALEAFTKGKLTPQRALEVLGMTEPRMVPIKSAKAREYERGAAPQIPTSARAMFTGPVRVTLRIYYASERPDLDESVVLDVLQARYTGKGSQRELVTAGVYANDRQVREKHVYHAIDKRNPRAEIEVEEIAATLFESLPVISRAEARHMLGMPAITAAADPF